MAEPKRNYIALFDTPVGESTQRMKILHDVTFQEAVVQATRLLEPELPLPAKPEGYGSAWHQWKMECTQINMANDQRRMAVRELKIWHLS